MRDAYDEKLSIDTMKAWKKGLSWYGLLNDSVFGATHDLYYAFFFSSEYSNRWHNNIGTIRNDK